MKDLMEYRGYYGDATYSAEDHVFYGKLQGINALVDYSGDSVSELEASFHEAVEDYLIFCEDQEIQPETPLDDTITIQLSPSVRAKVIDISHRRKISINRTIEQAVEAYEG